MFAAGPPMLRQQHGFMAAARLTAKLNLLSAAVFPLSWGVPAPRSTSQALTPSDAPASHGSKPGVPAATTESPALAGNPAAGSAEPEAGNASAAVQQHAEEQKQVDTPEVHQADTAGQAPGVASVSPRTNPSPKLAGQGGAFLLLARLQGAAAGHGPAELDLSAVPAQVDAGGHTSHILSAMAIRLLFRVNESLITACKPSVPQYCHP